MDHINWDDFLEEETHTHFRELTPSDFYFCFDLRDLGDGHPIDGYYIITPKKFFDQRGYLFEHRIQDAIAHILPRDFFEDSYGVFLYDGDDDDGDVGGKRLLIRAGFVENSNLCGNPDN